MLKKFVKIESRLDKLIDIRIGARKNRDSVALEETEEEFAKALADYKEAVYLKHSMPKVEDDDKWDIKKLPKMNVVPESFL